MIGFAPHGEHQTVEASSINLPSMEVAIEGPRSDIPQEQSIITYNPNIGISGLGAPLTFDFQPEVTTY